MTRILFYHGASDKLATACRLIGELYKQGRKIVVYAPDATLAQRIDQLLWTQPAIGFFPHCAATSPLAAETPILIARALEALAHDDVLVNLDGELPSAFSRFEQLIEIVGLDDEDRMPARSRYKFYRDRGYPLETQNLGGSAAP